jgi:cell division protein FtsZ
MLGEEDLSFIDAFRKADEVLFQAVKGISDLITQNGIVNVDFADVKTVMNSMGRALMGTGIAKGNNRARLAAEMAVSSPLLDDISVDGATGVLINIVGGSDLKMREIQEAASLVQEQAHEDANIIFGASIDEALGENVKVTVIATGFDNERMAQMNEAARASVVPPQTVPSMQYMPQQMAHAQVGQVSQRAHFQQPPQHHPQPAPQQRMSEAAPAFSSRRIPASQDSRLSPASTRVPARERATSNFPAFDTDWDVPAFQRKGQ